MRKRKNQEPRAWHTVRKGREHLVIRWIDRWGERGEETAGTSSRRIARRLAAKKEAELKAATETKDLTWPEFCSIYTDEWMARIPNSLNHWNSVKAAIRDFGAPAWLDQIDERFVAKFTIWMAKRHTAATINSYLKRFRHAIGWASTLR